MATALPLRRRARSKLMMGLSIGCAVLGLAMLALILGTLLYNGVSGLNLAVFTEMTPAPGEDGGLLNAIFGSLVMTVIGVVIGTGSYLTGVISAVATLIALAALRRLEDRLPTQWSIHLEIGFQRDRGPREDELRDLVAGHGFSMREMSYRLQGSPQLIEYKTIIWTNDATAIRKLEQTLIARPDIAHFSLSPNRD